jgi:MraZ protein
VEEGGELGISSGSHTVFRGTFEQKIDDKGRVNVPAKFQKVLKDLADDRLFVTNLRIGDVRCLEARPYAEWLKLEARIAERTDLSPAAMEFYDNFYLPGAQECQVDKQGRLLVPPTLRDYAGLLKDVVFTGSRGKFRIWDKAKWQPVHSAGEQIGVSEPGVLGELGL